MLYCNASNNDYIVYIALQGRARKEKKIFTWYCTGASKQTKKANITRHEIKMQGYDNERSTTQQSNFLYMIMSIFFVLYCERSNDNYMFDVAKRSYCEGACNNNKEPSRDARSQQSNFYMLLITIMMAMSVCFMQYCKEQRQQSYFCCVARSDVNNG